MGQRKLVTRQPRRHHTPSHLQARRRHCDCSSFRYKYPPGFSGTRGGTRPWTTMSATYARWTAARTIPLLSTLSPMTLPTTSGTPLSHHHHEELSPRPYSGRPRATPVAENGDIRRCSMMERCCSPVPPLSSLKQCRLHTSRL